jgi:hypothetical protein
MTQQDSAVGPTVAQRWRSARWVVLAIVVIIAVAVLSTYLTAPREGERMEATSTSSDGARAIVTLLRDNGVDVIVADDFAAVQPAGSEARRHGPARPGRHLRSGRRQRRIADALLRRRAGPIHRRRAHHNGRRLRGLHDQLRPAK